MIGREGKDEEDQRESAQCAHCDDAEPGPPAIELLHHQVLLSAQPDLPAKRSQIVKPIRRSGQRPLPGELYERRLGGPAVEVGLADVGRALLPVVEGQPDALARQESIGGA